jgi:hypothetical protein
MRRGSLGITVESVLWIAMLGLGAAVRFSGLGASPLNPGEAVAALAASAGTPEASAFWDAVRRPGATSALYNAATHTVFLLGGTGEAAARAVPAMAGVIPLVVLWILRRRLGSVQAMFLGLWAAISPAWLANARTAGDISLSMAAAAAVVALGWGLTPSAEWPRKAVFACAVGFGLASGPGFFTWAAGLGLAYWLWRRWDDPRGSLLLSGWSGRAVGELTLWSVVAACGIGTAIGTMPSGFEALFAGVRTWLMSWIQPGNIALGTSFLLLVSYEPMILLLAALDAVLSFRSRDRTGRFLLVWAILALALFLATIGRRPEDSIWPLIPLGLMAARAVAHEVEGAGRVGFPWATAVLWAALLLLAGFVQMQLSAYVNGVGPAADVSLPQLRIPIALGGMGLGAVVVVLVGFGWDWATARAAAMAAVVTVLLAITVSASWHLNLTGDVDRETDLWRPQQGASGLIRLHATIESLALAQTGTQSIAVNVAGGAPTASVAWALRGFPGYIPDDTGPGRAPPIVVQPEAVPLPSLPAKYLGQAISVGHAWGWTGPWPPDWLQLWVRHEAPLIAETWVLYVREDVATLTPAEADVSP